MATDATTPAFSYATQKPQSNVLPITISVLAGAGYAAAWLWAICI